MPQQIALVTGGSKGIGLAMVRGLVGAGYQVVSCGRQAATWQQAVAESPELAGVDFQVLDLTAAGAVDGLFQHIGSRYGRLDVLINNASPRLVSGGPFEQLAPELLQQTLLSDLWVPALCLRLALPLMAEGGSVVNISSINGVRPAPNVAMYGAAKHGLESLTRSVALEAINRGIRINAIAPGVTWTPRWEQRVAAGMATREAVEQQIPARRFALPEEIAAAALWLISDAASYIVGHTLVMDGGLTLA